MASNVTGSAGDENDGIFRHKLLLEVLKSVQKIAERELFSIKIQGYLIQECVGR
jgi:hypothetical protein